ASSGGEQRTRICFILKFGGNDTERSVTTGPTIVYAALTLTIFLAQQSAISGFFHRLSDKTFSGIYHPNAFDLAMMIPYFIVLLVLAMYGLHRYWLVYEYFQSSKNVPPLPPPVTNWPRITVQLPI